MTRPDCTLHPACTPLRYTHPNRPCTPAPLLVQGQGQGGTPVGCLYPYDPRITTTPMEKN